MKFLFLDTETGGLDLNTSLLTAFFAIADYDTLEVEKTLSLKLVPDDGIYQVNAQALSINKIDLVEHQKEAISYTRGGKELYQFLSDNKPEDLLIPVGHGVAFDLRHIWDKLLRRNTWENFVSYRLMDTGIIFRFLQMIGKVTCDARGSLDYTYGWACGLLGGNHPLVKTIHTADSDTYMTIHVVKAIKSINYGQT